MQSKHVALIGGGVVVVGLAAYLLWPKNANAADLPEGYTMDESGQVYDASGQPVVLDAVTGLYVPGTGAKAGGAKYTAQQLAQRAIAAKKDPTKAGTATKGPTTSGTSMNRPVGYAGFQPSSLSYGGDYGLTPSAACFPEPICPSYGETLLDIGPLHFFIPEGGSRGVLSFSEEAIDIPANSTFGVALEFGAEMRSLRKDVQVRIVLSGVAQRAVDFPVIPEGEEPPPMFTLGPRGG